MIINTVESVVFEIRDNKNNNKVNLVTIALPADTFKITGDNIFKSNNLKELIAEVGAENLDVTYQAKLHICFDNYVPEEGRRCDVKSGIYGYFDGDMRYTVLLESNVDPNGACFNSSWVALNGVPNSHKNYLSQIQFLFVTNECGGLPVIREYQLTVRAQITVNTLGLCLVGDNVFSQDQCYDIVKEYLANPKNTDGRSSVKKYLKGYCASKYSGKKLSDFVDPTTLNPRDSSLCACNMPDEYYQEFTDSLRTQFPNLSIDQNQSGCLLPMCNESGFMENTCQIPKCFRIVEMDGNRVKGKVDIYQNTQCEEIGIGKKTPPVPPKPTPPGPPPDSKSWFDKYKYYLIAVVLVIIILIVLATILFLKFRRSGM